MMAALCNPKWPTINSWMVHITPPKIFPLTFLKLIFVLKALVKCSKSKMATKIYILIDLVIK